MLRKKIMLSFLFSLFSFNVLWADSPVALTCKENYDLDSAKQLLQEVQKKYEEVKDVHATFVQSSYLAAVDTDEGSSGEVWISKPSKMKWQYLIPEEQVFLMNDKTLWYYQPLDRQVLVQNFDDVVLTDLPVAFLLGIGDLRRDFELKEACLNERGVILSLKPHKGQDGKQELEGFKLLIDRSMNFPSGAEIIHLGGNKTVIILENVRLQEKLGADIFKADFPKGIDVNDMRR